MPAVGSLPIDCSGRADFASRAYSDDRGRALFADVAGAASDLKLMRRCVV
jgi:hypothetical protein